MSINAPTSALTFQPQYIERPWGGRNLEKLFGRRLPADHRKYGESWEISDRPEAQSKVVSGEYAGKTLNDLWINHREAIFGKVFAAHQASRFPLLIKLLDAREPLSVQVHPNTDHADKLGGEAKNEWWYILEAEPKAEILAGLRDTQGLTCEELHHDERIVEQLNHFTPKKGDSFYIPGGTVHALGGGISVFEVQQNSDTCYRLFDWNRVNSEGQSRPLHWDEALQVIQCHQVVKQETQNSFQGLECEHFVIEKMELHRGEEAHMPFHDRFGVGLVAGGEIFIAEKIFKSGDLFMIPASAPFKLKKVKNLSSHSTVVWVSLG